ncbi:MAG: glycosyltransferase, partial [Myxococcota bacterium]
MTGAPPVLRSLHVAAMPFPSPQGTQAAVRAMVEAVAEHGGETTLVTYPYGTRPAGPFPFRWLRLRDVPRVRSMRSGPSLGKIALDAQLVHRLRAWTRRMRPDLVVAHHVEAAAAAVMAGTRPVIYAAHTALGPELPAYLPRVLAPAGAAAGRILERWVARSASAVAAIAPALDHHLRALGVGHVHAWPLPWRVPSPLARPERERARRALGLDPAGEVGLYTGNLDAYQGWRALVGALTRPGAARARLLVATASDPAPLWAEARQAGVAERITVAGLADEAARRAAHAAADLALVPRRIPGGIPVKLLDALARGVP